MSKVLSMQYGSAQSQVDRPRNKPKRDSFMVQIAGVAIAIVLLGALASIELAIFRHGAGARFGLLATATLVAGTSVVALLAIGYVRRENPYRAKVWTYVLVGSIVYFVTASVVADQFYVRGAFAFGAPRALTAQRQIDAAEARLAKLAANRAPTGYNEDQRWAIAVNRSLIKAAETDIAYAKAVPESDQVYPQYATGDENAPSMKHTRVLIDKAEERRKEQGYPVYEPLPGYLAAPSIFEARIAKAKSLAAGADAQVPLCKSGRAAGYPRIASNADVQACEQDWHAQALKHIESVRFDQQQLDFQREAIAKMKVSP